MKVFLNALAGALSLLAVDAAMADAAAPTSSSGIDFRWDVKIPMRDGVKLSANIYIPKQTASPPPCVFSLTPYIAQGAHFRGVYFAPRGVTYAAVDSRGRGNSGGEFRPFIQEANDGYDVVEWLAKQPYCNGKVSMWGGSYLGYAQWATAKERPPHLAAIMPIASGYPGLDFPMRYNIGSPYPLQWMNYTAGKAGQDMMFADWTFWGAKFHELYEAGVAFADYARYLNLPSSLYEEWAAHPQLDAYWDRYVPTAQQYAKLQIPILTITGSYDGDQPGALGFYRNHLSNASAEEQARHYLIIGPWDHAGTVAPKREVGGLTFGPASLLNTPQLATEWYKWTMAGGPKPAFLQKRVAYYVMGAETWRYAETLEAITASSQPYYLGSSDNPSSVFHSGVLSAAGTNGEHVDHYTHDPRDTSQAAAEAAAGRNGFVEQTAAYTGNNLLIYHSAPFEADTEISGFFKLSAWISIDQRDTDISASVYEIDRDGGSVLLTTEGLRARYRDSLREPKLVETAEPLRYEFQRFHFTSRLVKKGHRLRLVIRPIDSIFTQRNYNGGGIVAKETLKDAKPVTVKLFHDQAHPSVLHVPLGHPRSANEPTAPASALIGFEAK